MLMLLFNLSNSRYAIAARTVVEIAPLVRLEAIARAPDYIAGLFNYRGQHVPVVDLCRLIAGRGCEDSFTSRVMLVEFPLPDKRVRLLGLLAERVTETVNIDADTFSDTGVSLEDAPYLGEAAITDHGLIQKVCIEDLLSDNVRTLLFPQEAG